MNVSVRFHRSPSLVEWQQALTPGGWKTTRYTENQIQAKNRFGESKFPIRNATTWYIIVENNKNGVVVTLSVPAFTESDYARHRMLGTIEELAAEVDGECATDDSLNVDILEQLRHEYENEK